LVRRPLIGLLYQPRIMDDECEVGGMRIGMGNRSIRRKPAPVPLCPPQILHDLTWARTRGYGLRYFYSNIYTEHFPSPLLGLLSVFCRNKRRRMRSPFVCVSPNIAREQLGVRVPMPLLGNGSVNTFQRQHVTLEELFDAVFSVLSISYQIFSMQGKKGRKLVFFPRTYCFIFEN
jgi:hypothetical protein